jgi:hypothetical protein
LTVSYFGTKSPIDYGMSIPGVGYLTLYSYDLPGDVFLIIFPGLGVPTNKKTPVQVLDIAATSNGVKGGVKVDHWGGVKGSQ